MEQVMLGVRLREGLPVEGLDVPEHLRARGWVDGAALDAGRLVLTRSGRLMADAVVRDLLGYPAA
jgi:oxygen-independent coproporphyrinogen-3 oxidase